MKTNKRLAGDDNGFMVLAIVLLVLAIVMIVLVYFWPFYTIGALMIVGGIVLLFNGTIQPKFAMVLMIAGAVLALLGVVL